MNDEFNTHLLPPIDLRIKKHLEGLTDISLIVLRGHLIVEEELFDLVASISNAPELLRKGNLGFYNIASVAKALLYQEKYKSIWDAVFALNSLRNALAHHLETDELASRIEKFGIAIYGGQPKAGRVLVGNPRAIIAAIEYLAQILSHYESVLKSERFQPINRDSNGVS